MALFLAFRCENRLKWIEILKPLKQFLVYQGSSNKHCEARAWAGQPG